MASNCGSVSPQKPTMTSVEMAIPGTAARTGGEPLAVVLDRVLAAHPVEYRVVARLDRQVEVLADRSGTRRSAAMRRSDRSHGCEVTKRRRGMAGRAVGRPQAVDGPDELGEVRAAEQVEASAGPPFGGDVGEPFLGRQVVAVRVHVLAEQRDLAIAGARERPRLGDDLVERAAALRAAAERARCSTCTSCRSRRRSAARRWSARCARIVPSPTAAARVEGRWSAAPTTVRPTTVVMPIEPRRASDPTAPIAPCAEARPSRSTSSGSSSGRRKRSTAGKRRAQAGPVALADGAPGQHDAQRRVGGLELGQLALPADDLLFGRLADRRRC